MENDEDGFKVTTAGVLMSLAVVLTMMGALDDTHTMSPVIGGALVSLVNMASRRTAAVTERRPSAGGDSSRLDGGGGLPPSL